VQCEPHNLNYVGVDVGYRAQYSIKSFDGAVNEWLTTRMCVCCEVQTERKKSVPVGEGALQTSFWYTAMCEEIK